MRGWLDSWMFRQPFEGMTARRYSTQARPAFGDLDRRVLDALSADLRRARVLLDLGAGGGEFSRLAATEWKSIRVIGIEPSPSFSRSPEDGFVAIRASAEALPLADGSVDVAICLTSLRHMRDRELALRELRRVVRKGGAAWIVELDSASDRERAERHANAMPSWLIRNAFRFFVLPLCPDATYFAELAKKNGWSVSSVTSDPEQPFFVMRLE